MNSPNCLEQKLNWLYIDINSYFATIEQQLNKELRYKPVAVVPMMTDATCAIAASYEAKRFGIKTGTKIFDAKKLCPELICIKAEHKKYVHYHKKIFDVIDSVLKVDHIFSIDEGACRLTGKYQDGINALNIAKLIKDIIKEKVGDYINCSIGIAPNRYLAKIASNLQKPDGLSIIESGDIPEKLYNLKLSDFPSIGIKTNAKLEKNSINTTKHLYALAPKQMRQIWGNVHGERLWYLLRGADLPLQKTNKSVIGHSKILEPKHRSAIYARNILLSLAQKATKRLRGNNLYCSNFTLSVKPIGGKTIKIQMKFESSCKEEYLISNILIKWDKLINNYDIKNIKKVSINLHGLRTNNTQLNLFDQHKNQTDKKLSNALDAINNKHGANTITIGILPKQYQKKDIIAFSHIPE